MGQRRVWRGISVVALGAALAIAPMATAGAKSKPKHHHKPKHTTTKTVSKGGSDPKATICTDINSAQSSSGNIGTTLEKAFTGGATNWAAVKQAMLNAINTGLKEEGPAESVLRSAPANVQAAMKGIFAFENSLVSAISSSTSALSFEQSMASLATNPALKTDSTILTNYVTSLCGSTTTTTTAVP